MINYVEKGCLLHEALSAEGLTIRDRDGEWLSDANHDEVNEFIKNFNELNEGKVAKKSELVKDSENLLNVAVLDKYPRFEIDTWTSQQRDAEAYNQDNNAITPTLDALANQRGITKREAAEKILTKAPQFEILGATYAGERQRLEDLVDKASTVEEIEAIKFKAL